MVAIDLKFAVRWVIAIDIGILNGIKVGRRWVVRARYRVVESALVVMAF